MHGIIRFFRIVGDIVTVIRKQPITNVGFTVLISRLKLQMPLYMKTERFYEILKRS